MNRHGGLGGIWRWARTAIAEPAPGGEAESLYGAAGAAGYGGSVWRGLSGRSLELAEVQQEVAAELRGQVLVVGLHDAANRGLLARLRGQPPAPPAGPIYREGFFTLLTLPAEPATNPEDAGNGAAALALGEVLGLVSEADVLLYVALAAHGWQEADARWHARLRASGRPLIVVAGERSPDSLATRAGGPTGRWPVGERPVTMGLTPLTDECEAPADVLALVDRILEQCGRLAIPLAQEIPGCRPMVAGRAIRSAMLMAALLGAEPIPLLDLPLQVALNWKLALQLAAIYGQPGLDYRSREMIGTVAWNLGLRHVIQQALKLVPVLGWAASAGLSGLGAWLLGNALWRYFRDAERWRAAPQTLQLRLADGWARLGQHAGAQAASLQRGTRRLTSGLPRWPVLRRAERGVAHVGAQRRGA